MATWNAEALLELARSYRAGCVLAAAAELELFERLADGTARTAEELARAQACDQRGLTMLLDALAALGLLDKRAGRYALPPSLGPLVSPGAPTSVLAMVQHQANCLARWSQLARVVKSGTPAPRQPSLRGEHKDAAAFIGAMHAVSDPHAARLMAALPLPPVRRLLDVGGASGTWTLAVLAARPEARATIFDLPHVLPLAQERLLAAGVADRVELVAGDYLKDELPGGADLAWVSAIVHQHSREENRWLLANVRQALAPGGQVWIRDILMDDTRTAPLEGALFAINMLVSTTGGLTYALGELRTDLEAAGFVDVRVIRPDEGMNAVVGATRPA